MNILWGIYGFNRLAAMEGEGGGSGGGGDPAAEAAAAAAATAAAAAAKVEADKVAADKVAADKVAADKIAADKVAAEAAAKDPVKLEEARVKALGDARVANVPKDGVYGDFKLAEGIQKNDTAIAAFSALAKEAGLSKAEAQKFVDLQGQVAIEAKKADDDNWAKVNTAWKNELASDKEFGGDKVEATKSSARDVAQKIGGKELVESIDALGLADHPKLILAFAKIGKLMTEANIDPATLSPAAKAKVAGLEGTYDHPTSQSQS